MTDPPVDPVEATRRILAAAESMRVPVRAIGGVGIALRAPSVGRLRPPRTYHDLDLAGRPPRAPLEALLVELGYEPSVRFNTMNGSERLLFHDRSGRRVDVFLDTLRMCHVLPFGSRLELEPDTLPLADLALSKLQIVELTERDGQDLAALFADHGLTDGPGGIDRRRIAQVCAADWGWWRTVDGNLARLADAWRATAAAPGDPAAPDDPAAILGLAAARAEGLRTDLAAAPKTAAWRLRAAIGERRRWYEEPEEIR